MVGQEPAGLAAGAEWLFVLNILVPPILSLLFLSIFLSETAPEINFRHVLPFLLWTTA